MPGRRLRPRAPHGRVTNHAGPQRDRIDKSRTMSVVSPPSTARLHANGGSSAADPSRAHRQ